MKTGKSNFAAIASAVPGECQDSGFSNRLILSEIKGVLKALWRVFRRFLMAKNSALVGTARRAVRKTALNPQLSTLNFS